MLDNTDLTFTNTIDPATDSTPFYAVLKGQSSGSRYFRRALDYILIFRTTITERSGISLARNRCPGSFTYRVRDENGQYQLVILVIQSVIYLKSVLNSEHKDMPEVGVFTRNN